MRQLLIRWAVLALSVLVAIAIVPGISLDGSGIGQVLTIIGMALILGVLNTFVKPILKLFSLPLIALTLGLFLLVINTALFALSSWLLDDISVDGFFPALGGAIVVSVVGWLMSFIVPDDNN